MIDCLLLGYYDTDFPQYVEMVSSMGRESGAFRDLNLAFVNYEGRPYRSLDLLNRFYFEGRTPPGPPFHNADFLWPVITYLGTYLAKRGLSFDYVNLPHLERETLKAKLEDEEVLTVAISTTLYVSPQPIIELVSIIRQHNKTVKIVVGGPFIANQPKLTDTAALESLFKYLNADVYVISQEGEAALVELIRALKSGDSLDKVENIAYRGDGRYIFTATSIESNPLEENQVDYRLFPRQEIDQFVTLRTAKSCPFSCAFCGFPQRAGKYKYLGVDCVERELNAIADIGTVTTLTFIDDTFNVPKERFRQLLAMMISNNYGFKWNCFYRSDHGDERTIELMARAGCEGVFLGVESGSDEILGKMNKTARRKDYLKSIPLLRAAGISTHANFIVGFPGETFSTVQESIELIEITRPDYYRAQLWYADPITPIWQSRGMYGVTGFAFNWSHNTMDSAAACDLIDEMFVSIEGSIWLPQNGFEQWSTFYLQRKGMSEQQLKTFLRCFNSLVKEKLVYAGGAGPEPALIDTLKNIAQFDRNRTPDMRPIEAWSGYYDAERYWCEEFAGATGSTLRPAAETAGNPGSSDQKLVSALDRPHVARIAGGLECEIEDLLIAAYAAAVAAAAGTEQVSMVVSRAGEHCALPLRLRLPPGTRFIDLIEMVRSKKAEGSRHRTFAFQVLGSSRLAAANDGLRPRIELGFRIGDRPPESGEIHRELSGCRWVADQILLTLATSVDNDANDANDAIVLELGYRPGSIRTETIAELMSSLKSLTEQADKNSTALLGDLIDIPPQAAAGRLTETLVEETFNF